MSRGTRFVTVGQDDASVEAESQVDVSAQGAAPFAESGWPAESYEEEAVVPRDWTWLIPATAVVAIAAWTAFFVWSQLADMTAAGAPSRWTWWISTWSTPVLLVCVVWLLALRHSRSEAKRFGNVARLLSVQADALETRLITVNQELSLAREFIAAQSRDLESLGRVAVERLSTHADRLQSLIADNSAQVEAIGTVSNTALDNMERLRGQLPVIASSAKDVTNNIGNAGRTAQAQLIEMVNGFTKLNEFGKASERQVAITRQSIGEAVTEFAAQAEQLDRIATDRFAALAERGAEFRHQLDGQEVEALAAIRSRAQALIEELAQSRDFVGQSEEDTIAALRTRLGAIRDESAVIAQSLQETEASALGSWQNQVATLKTDILTTLISIEQADSQVQDAARARRATFMEEVEEADAMMSERSAYFAEQIDRRRNEAIEQDAAVLAQFSERLRALDQEIAERRSRQQQDTAALAAHGDAVAGRLAELEARIAEIVAHGGEAEATLASGLQSLSVRFAASREALSATGRDIAGLTDSSVRLLELIQAGAQHSANDLPAAISRGVNQLETIEGRIFALRDAVEHANANSGKLSAYVLAAGEAIRSTIGELDGLHDRIDNRAQQHIGGVENVRAALVIASAELDELAARSRAELDAVAERSRTELTGAIEQLSATARGAVASLEEQSAAAVAELAHKLTEDSRAAIDQALKERAAEIAGQLEAAATSAAGISREATVQLRDQLVRVNELTSNLERRIAHARERAEEQVGQDFTRRVALITETLNSNAIDIAKALSSDVSDSAWGSYLKGDRGIFTRRAVTLLGTSEARSIGQLYEADRDFAEHVNRYIHDFEAMLRQLLSTRDGHALGVTILSSDMGKLYVALAQGIERLRN